MGGWRSATTFLVMLSGVLLIVDLFAAMPGSRAGASASVWLQTMDSCQQALGGAGYQIVSTNGTNFTVSAPAASPVTVNSAAGHCPLQQGNCVSLSTGCVDFQALPPGTYTIHEVRLPSPHGSNSEGYAPCTGGSACRLEYVTLIVNSDLTARAWVTNVYPDGTTVCWPGGTTLPVGTTQTCQQTGVAGYTGTPANPIVTHNFGLAPPGSDSSAPHECDISASEPTGDADDHLTGTPSSHCRYPEAQEGTWCGGDTAHYPFPWSCTLAVQTTPTPTSCSSPVTTSFSGTVGGNSSVSRFVSTTAAGTLSANAMWTPLNSVNLIVYTSSSRLLGQTGFRSTGNSTETLQNLSAATYKVKVQDNGSTSVNYQLHVTHC